MRATKTAAVKIAIARMIAPAMTTISPPVIQPKLRRLPPPHTSDNVRLSLIAETSTAMRLMQRGRPDGKLLTGRSNGDAYVTVYATAKVTR